MIGLEYIRKMNLDTVDSLAKKLNVSKGLISQWENQKAPIPAKRLKELSKLYDVSSEYFSRSLTKIEKLCLQREKMLYTSKKVGEYTIENRDHNGEINDRITIDGKVSMLKLAESLQIIIDFERIIQEIYENSGIYYTDDAELSDVILSAVSVNQEYIYIIEKFVTLLRDEHNLLFPSILKAVELSKVDNPVVIHNELVNKLIPIFSNWRSKEMEKADIEYQEYKELFDVDDEDEMK